AAQCFGIRSLISHCDLLALSFNPFKNIGSLGKSGAVLTLSPELARLARQYSYHGFAEGKKNIKAQNWGLNSRMDNLQ
ncbi:DegT/DnrJ/EryC1/StrS family aminotransferase, partial [Shigella dysenteriae]